ncbi:metalloregulator ArsR/SmtB family transcription factor [Chenggangzhangella methanolivorans]|uniref:Metalloregulator ArsR/SmtB family transcription factor n=1 Tax=Chenggangzhangella methanolivorans TaxID=1437009 RepID=A0A9E6RE67_9HYPH|nr:metalloregulator ArsR/SmtB family transcription factor [Chenggangzhangella methanolivorans]QZO02355.1 metalloregulator ArsR/SmtB family transcription factor [Chenggangzhangella methanolivorans]
MSHEAVTRERADAAGEFLKGLANPNRLMIAARLMAGEASVGELEASLGIRQPTLSQQLAGLRDAGLVEARRDAKQVFYRLVDHRAAEVVGVLQQIFGLATTVGGHATRTPTPHAPSNGRSHGAARFAQILPFPEAQRGRR